MKTNFNQRLASYAMILFVLFNFSSCSDDKLEQDLESSLKKNELPVKTEKVNLSNSRHYTEISARINNLNEKLYEHNKSDEDPEEIAIALYDILYSEYENTHTYTFKIIRERPKAYIENLVLHYDNKAETYKEYVVAYHITDEEFIDISNGSNLQSSKDVVITSVDEAFFPTDLINRSCSTVCQTIFIDCASGEHNSGNIEDWADCIYGGTRNGPSAYQSCTSSCPTIDAGESGSGGGSGTGTSSGGDPGNGNIITNPNPDEPCEQNGSVGLSGGGECNMTVAETQAFNDLVQILGSEDAFEFDDTIDPDSVPQELHFDTSEELQAFIDGLNSTNVVSQTIFDPGNPNKVIEKCTFPDMLLNFNVFIEQTIGDDYSVDDVTSNVSGITVFVAYEQLNWTTAFIDPQINISNVIVNSEAELTLIYKGVGTIATFDMNFDIFLNMSNGTQNSGTLTVD